MGEIEIYISNIKLNLLDTYYMFYEWLPSDDIKNYSKIKVVKVDNKTIKNIINNKIELLENMKDNIIIFSDLQSSIAVEFCNKISIYKSSISLIDEKKINNKIYSSKEKNIKYIIIEKEYKTPCYRASENIKKVIKTEINTLINNNHIDKIKYLYYEWFKKNSNNKKQMINRMQEQLSRNITNEEKRIYEIIKLSYKCV